MLKGRNSRVFVTNDDAIQFVRLEQELPQQKREKCLRYAHDLWSEDAVVIALRTQP